MMDEQIIMVPIGPIARNQAQMRTRYDLVKLAELTMQMVARGFDRDKPLLIRQLANGKTPAYENIRGHRRRMAFLMSQHLLAQQDKDSWELDAVRVGWETLSAAHDNDVETAAESLVPEHGRAEVPAVLFDGDPKQATLALWSDNYGDEKPDPLGIAMSLLAGVKLGIKPEEAAGHMGQGRSFVENHLALGQINQDVAQRIADGDLSISMAPILLSLPDEKRAALSEFILMTPAHAITVANVRRTAKQLKELAFDMPISFPNASRRNIARAFLNLWHQKLEENVTRAYLGACAVLYATESYRPPWDDLASIPAWLQALGLPASSHWAETLLPYLYEVSCLSCPIKKLPEKILKTDLISPALPCRKGAQVNRCIHGLTRDDPFHVRLPMAWAKHPGVKDEAGSCVAVSFNDLLSAYEAQAEQEAAASAAAATKEAAPTSAKGKSKGKTDDKKKKGTGKKEEPAGPPPVEVMRQQIGGFIEKYGEGYDHFMTMTCPTCQHRTEDSDKVPGCAWASQHRNVSFRQIQPLNNGELPAIPTCRQYAPDRPWREIIPTHPSPGDVPREWLVEQIIRLANDHADDNPDYKPFQWLTGRPMASNERYGDWFEKQFAQQKGELSNAQIFTLFLLVHTEWKRAEKAWNSDGIFTVPANEQMAQFISVKDVALEVN